MGPLIGCVPHSRVHTSSHQPSEIVHRGQRKLSTMIMDGDDFEGFEDIIDEIEEDICVEDDEDEEEDLAFVSNGGGSGEDDIFDAIVGKLEEIIMDEEFSEQTTEFMGVHCVHFERGDEQKLEYTDIFQRYTTLIEEHVERGLSEGVPDFSMEQFLSILEEREDEVSADVFDMLLTMSDFELFKEQMLEYKEQCVEKTSTGFLCISGRPTVLHTEDMEDGEERFDLMDGLSIKPLSPTGLAAREGPPPFGVIPQVGSA